MPTRISLRRVEEPPRASSWPYPVRWPNFSRMRRRLENAPLLVGLKPRSKCSNQSFGRGASSYLCAVPRPTDQPLTTLSASKHDRPTDQRAVVGDFGWQLSKNPRRCAAPWDGLCARAASFRYIAGLEVRPVHCHRPAPSRPCLLVGRPARVDFMVAAGWIKRRPGRRVSCRCKLSSGVPAPLGHPSGPGGCT